MDFLNLVDIDQGAAKRACQSQSLKPLVGKASISVGNICFAEFLNDMNYSCNRLDAPGHAGNRVELEARLLVEDSSNIAGVVFDVVRFCRLMTEGTLNQLPDLRDHIQSCHMNSSLAFRGLARGAEILLAASNLEVQSPGKEGERRVWHE
jgi:myo-inositol-1-phosphate synthase